MLSYFQNSLRWHDTWNYAKFHEELSRVSLLHEDKTNMFFIYLQQINVAECSMFYIATQLSTYNLWDNVFWQLRNYIGKFKVVNIGSIIDKIVYDLTVFLSAHIHQLQLDYGILNFVQICQNVRRHLTICCGVSTVTQYFSQDMISFFNRQDVVSLLCQCKPENSAHAYYPQTGLLGLYVWCAGSGISTKYTTSNFVELLQRGDLWTGKFLNMTRPQAWTFNSYVVWLLDYVMKEINNVLESIEVEPGIMDKLRDRLECYVREQFQLEPGNYYGWTLNKANGGII